ncbi:hypothetical protein HU200_000469 [Digitaria exilis]|uniref:Uncharacterized protein n=1 Tax=Digitaria exilis TaxID=1010633 RepID=A0A835KYF6_9POAL|nr:hypothetical protein HU200_000469 [Digitaria exilis]
MDSVLGSAVVQEAISRVTSIIFVKREEKESRKHNIEKLEMAHTELELAIERSGKLPITDVSLLRRRKILKRAYKECSDVLHRCKHQAQEDEDIEGGFTPSDSSFAKRIARATESSFAYFFPTGKDDLSSSNVRRFGWLADCASKFVRDVESGCSLRHYTFCNPLIRHLLQGKTLKHEMKQESKFRYFHLWPICLEERGVEAHLQYLYVDHKALEKSFVINLLLRLSESTDLVGVAIKCLQSLTSLFNLAAETITGELALLANLHDMSQSYDPPAAVMQGLHTEYTHFWRPNPVCCKEDGHKPSVRNMVLSELSHRFPEQVILFSFTCSFPALEFSMCSSSDETSTSIMTHRQQPLQVTVAFTPHCMTHKEQESYATEIVGDNEEQPINDVSMQQEAETARSNAINYFLSQPELRVYGRMWRSEHGGAGFVVEKRSFDREGWPITHSWYMNRRSAKKGVRSFR